MASEKVATNKEFTKNPLFISACERAKVKPTARQASKFRMKQGLAFAHKSAPSDNG